MDIANRLEHLREKADKDPLIRNYLKIINKPEGIEYVSPEKSGRRTGYFRKRPCTRECPTLKQALHRLKFSSTAAETYGSTGTVLIEDDRRISLSAKLLGDKLKRTKPKQREPKSLTRLRNLLATTNSMSRLSPMIKAQL